MLLASNWSTSLKGAASSRRQPVFFRRSGSSSSLRFPPVRPLPLTLRSPKPSPVTPAATSLRPTTSTPKAAHSIYGARPIWSASMPSSVARPMQERPPCPSNEGMTVLDRTKFVSTLDVLAVRIGAREIGSFQREVQRCGDGFSLTGLKSVLADEAAADQKWCLLGKQDIGASAMAFDTAPILLSLTQLRNPGPLTVERLAPETIKLLEGRDVQKRTIDLTYDFWTPCACRVVSLRSSQRVLILVSDLRLQLRSSTASYPRSFGTRRRRASRKLVT